MSQAAEKVEQRSFIDDGVPLAQSSAGPVESPPALFDTSPIRGGGEAGRPEPEAEGAGAAQLPLPLGMDPEPPEAAPAIEGKPHRRRSKGFVPVTRDPDVARSYSDNIALDYAVARGLAQALGSLPPEELAALRAKVAKAARHNGKASNPR